MKAYVMDAFAGEVFGGNQAGVVIADRPLGDELMQRIAAEFKHSETAFLRLENAENGEIGVRYFTPAGEVELCGHATVASFACLALTGRIQGGRFTAVTKAGRLGVDVSGGKVLMDMAAPRLLGGLSPEDTAALYAAYALSPDDCPKGFAPAIVSTGLADIMLPVRDRAALLRAVQNGAEVSALSEKLRCIGVHMFAPGGGSCTAFCSNFAPLYGIPEECATGTANAALTYYLHLHGLIRPGEENLFIQGEHMGRPSRVVSILTEGEAGVLIRVGGGAVMSMECDIFV